MNLPDIKVRVTIRRAWLAPYARLVSQLLPRKCRLPFFLWAIGGSAELPDMK